VSFSLATLKLALRVAPDSIISSNMKFFWALVIWLVMGAIITAGIVVATTGTPWLLIIGLLGFIFLVGKIGCATH